MGVTAKSVTMKSVSIGNYTGPTDPYFANVALLLHADASNGSTTLVDSSSFGVNKTLTVNSTISTADFKFGTSSVTYTKQEFGLNGNNWVGPQFSRATGEAYTIEFFWKHISSTYASTAAPFIFAFRDGPNTGTLVQLAKYSTSNLISFRIGVNPSTEVAMPLNQWNHIAVTFNSSNTVNLWLNGTSILSGTQTATTGVNGIFVLGSGDGSSTNGLSNASGYIDELRVTKGVARYTSTFTPPSEPFPNS